MARPEQLMPSHQNLLVTTPLKNSQGLEVPPVRLPTVETPDFSRMFPQAKRKAGPMVSSKKSIVNSEFGVRSSELFLIRNSEFGVQSWKIVLSFFVSKSYYVVFL